MPFLFLLLGSGGILFGIDQYEKRQSEAARFEQERARIHQDRESLKLRLSEIEGLFVEMVSAPLGT